MKKKKSTVINREKFIESIYHIVFYGNTMRHFNEILKGIKGKVSEYEEIGIRYSIQWNVLIITVSLFDELNKYIFKYRSEDALTQRKIELLGSIIEPAIEEIKKWNDIRKFRNNVLAHNFRIDSNDFESVHLSNKLDSYNIPQSYLDLIILFKYWDTITKIAEEMFKDEYLEAITIVDGFVKKQKTLQPKEDEIEKANLILLEINKRISEYNSKC